MSASRWRISPSVGGFFRFLPSVTAEEALDMTEFSAEAGDFIFSARAAGQLITTIARLSVSIVPVQHYMYEYSDSNPALVANRGARPSLRQWIPPRGWRVGVLCGS